MISLVIEIKYRNRVKELFDMIKDKSKDIMFSFVSKIPERMIPSPIIQWLTTYLDRRTQELQQEIILQQWQKVYLEKAVSEIQNRQQDKNKAPQED